MEEVMNLYSIGDKYLAQQQPGWCVMLYPMMEQNPGAGKQIGYAIPSLSFIH